MGVIQKNLYVDGINLANYGLYVTGQSVYNAPQRDVELVAIPGRNGDYIIDNGRFQNIEVTYPAGLREDTTDFATRVAEIRNILASRHRYVRIEDDYNPDEYREGMFVSGLEVTPACHNIAGEFELVFNCKPQRFLKSGETAVSMASGSSITNPTAFESKPLIEFCGYGTMTVNGYEITVDNQQIGQVTLANAKQGKTQNLNAQKLAYLNTGDTVTLKESAARHEIVFGSEVTNVVWTDVTGNLNPSVTFFYWDNTAAIQLHIPEQSYSYGTAQVKQATVTMTVTLSGGVTATVVYTVMAGTNASMTTISINATDTITTTATVVSSEYSFSIGAVIGNSTQYVLGNPLYIDCELGDCYKIENGEMVFLNSYVSMPNDLPVLSAGSNSVTYDNTITDFKITPRWWRV